MIKVTSDPLSIDDCVSAVSQPDCGAVTVFLGTVRDNSEGVVTDHLEYEAYPEMAEETIRTITNEAASRWPIAKIAVQHRTGELAIGDVSVVVAVSAPHRGVTFEACRYVIDELKTRAPIWKKEFGEAGEYWVGGPASVE